MHSIVFLPAMILCAVTGVSCAISATIDRQASRPAQGPVKLQPAPRIIARREHFRPVLAFENSERAAAGPFSYSSKQQRPLGFAQVSQAAPATERPMIRLVGNGG